MENQHPNAITQRNQSFKNPFEKAKADHISHGTVAIESERAIAQIQAKVVMARKFPRDAARCYDHVMHACQDLNLAENAFYSYPKGGSVVHGPTIRLAEELARIWGNVEISINELSRREGETEMLAVAWDMESNVTQSVTFTVKHKLDTKQGPRDLNSERDVRDIAANVSGRKLRGRILALLPKTLVDSAVAQCYKTLAHSVGTNLDQERRAIVSALKEFSVPESAIKTKFGVKDISTLNADTVAKLVGIYKTIKANEATAQEIFELNITGKEIRDRSRAQRQASQQTEQKKEQPKETKETKEAPKEAPKETKKEVNHPKEGTVPWYKQAINRLDPKSSTTGLKLKELQALYTKLKEQSYREERGQQQQTKNEAPPPAEEPPASATEEPPGDDFFGDNLFDED